MKAFVLLIRKTISDFWSNKAHVVIPVILTVVCQISGIRDRENFSISSLTNILLFGCVLSEVQFVIDTFRDGIHNGSFLFLLNFRISLFHDSVIKSLFCMVLENIVLLINYRIWQSTIPVKSFIWISLYFIVCAAITYLTCLVFSRFFSMIFLISLSFCAVLLLGMFTIPTLLVKLFVLLITFLLSSISIFYASKSRYFRLSLV